MKNAISLRKKYSRFIYQKYAYSYKKGNLRACFYFKGDPDINFKAKVEIKNIPEDRFVRIDKKAINNFIFHLGLMEMPTYWKATCSPEIIIRAGFLEKTQTDWWRNLIIRGMSQFFYENKIDFNEKNFLKVSSNPSIEAQPLGIYSEELNDRYLVPVGGGKDSIVTLEKLKEEEKSFNCFLLNPKQAQKNILKVAGIKEPIIVERTIDPLLLKLNQQGYLNGHTPFTAVLSFLSAFCCVLFDYKNIAFSNEKSSNEENTAYLGKKVNHQYSKSSAFEKNFSNYCKKYLAEKIHYFSYLRKYGEFQIVKMFVKYPQYFTVFSSCNVGIKTKEKWCGNCPKCLFVYTCLYPYLGKKRINKIFKTDIFENKELLSTMTAMLGQGKHKPFECIGTYKESQKAFELSLIKAKKEGAIPFLLQKYEAQRTKK